MLNNNPITISSFFDFGYGKYLSPDETDYIGRQVIFYNHAYTVVQAKKNSKKIHCDKFGRPYKNDAELYLVCNYDNSEDGTGPNTHHTLASNIAEPNSTIIHWAHNVDYFRKNIDECHALYELGKKAERKRNRQRRTKDFLISQRENHRKEFFVNHTPEWAKAMIIAEYQVDDCDIMTDYFSSHVEKRVLLGFSRHERNNARELARFAARFEPTMGLFTEHRIEKYYGYQIMPKDMGYWGTGWIVRKTKSNDRVDFEHYLHNILPNLKF